MVIGFTGTRSPLAAQAVAIVKQILQQAPTGTRFLVGCCPSGLDQIVRQQFPCYCPPASGKSLQVFTAQAQTAAALRARTIAMVAQSQIIFAFPSSSAVWYKGKGSGTWLATFQASLMHKQVFVFLPGIPHTSLPTCHNIIGWSQICGSRLPQMSIAATFAYPQTLPTLF